LLVSCDATAVASTHFLSPYTYRKPEGHIIASGAAQRVVAQMQVWLAPLQ
jgi:hypothetical protein